MKSKKPSQTLSPAEQDILELIVEGLSNPEIADSLGIKMNTVRVHMKMILKKTGHKTRARLIVAELKERHLRRLMNPAMPMGRVS